MTLREINSHAFAEAALRSERTRTRAVIGVLVAMVLFVVFREFAATGDDGGRSLQGGWWAIVILGIAIAVECVLLRMIHLAAQRQRVPPDWIWTASLSFECALPTVAIFVSMNLPHIGPYKALSGPALLVYLIFIILSTLRLRPRLCLVGGVVSAGGFLAAWTYTLANYSVDDHPGALTMQIYATYAFMILAGAASCALLAAQIRNHVVAALNEAETQRKMDKIKRDLDIARSIQQGLLPKQPPEAPGYDIAGWNLPADETGGDYFDWQALPEGRVALSLADVTGHGVGPALVTAVCRAYSRASLTGGDDLGELMDRINDLLVVDLPDDRFITFVVALLDTNDNAVDLLSAGHGPILHYYAKTGEVEVFAAQGVPLAVMPDFGYGPARRHDMAPGDVLIMLTDGFFEWADATGRQYGLQRLEQFVADHADASAQDLIDRLYQDVLDYAGGTEQDDDLTAVVIKRDRT